MMKQNTACSSAMYSDNRSNEAARDWITDSSNKQSHCHSIQLIKSLVHPAKEH